MATEVIAWSVCGWPKGPRPGPGHRVPFWVWPYSYWASCHCKCQILKLHHKPPWRSARPRLAISSPPLTFETGNALTMGGCFLMLYNLVMCKSIKRIIWTSTLTLCAALNPNEGHLPQRESKHDLNSWTSNWVCMKNLQGLCGFVLSPPFLPCCVDPRLFAYDEHPFPHWVTQPKHGILSSRPETCFSMFFQLCSL